MSKATPVNQVSKEPGNVTRLLLHWGNGDSSALERLTPIIYEDLLRLARARIKREYGDCTLQPTALVHESYLRLADQTKLKCENRSHFYAVAVNVMRRILIDRARKRKADKRSGGAGITLKTDMDFAGGRSPDCLLLDEALRRLAQFNGSKTRYTTRSKLQI